MRRLSRDEGGAVLVFVALLLVVLFGFVGLAVDVGALYQERRELRNGADAGALAVAEDCALEAKPCDTVTAEATALDYANLNAHDGAAGVDGLNLDLTAQEVRVDTKTIDADTGSDKYQPFFMGALGIGGTTVHASATAKWGVPKSMTGIIPLVVSECEWDPTIIDTTVVLYFHGGAQSDETLQCNAIPGHDTDLDGVLPGGFGWIDATDCQLDTTQDGWESASADPGANIPSACKDYIQVGKVLIVPWFDDENGVEGHGSGGIYHISGFGAIKVQAYRFPGWRAGDPPCSGDEICLVGTVVEKTVDIGEFGTGPSHGVVLVKLIE